MEYQQAPPATTYSKKLANGGGLTGKHVYDGVFGGPVKPGSRMEDYREIFGGSATCSIPILDFPELNERNISIEARGMKPDYSVIFGGFEEADFAVPYEDMVSKPRKVKSRAREARVATETRSRSARPKHSNSSEEKSAPSPEVSSVSFDDGKQFNLSYNKSNPGSKNGTIGTTHITQLHEVPGYTCLIDEGVKAAQTTLNDARLNASASEGIKERKTVLKAVSGPQPQESAKNTNINNYEIPKKSRRHWSFANDISFDFEIGLGSQPSTPPNIGSDVGSKPEAFRSDDREGANGSYSPPLLDEEMDANSAAATSAAAVRKAIEEAQAKIRIAKELMERKRHGLPNHVKPSFTNGLKAKRRETKDAEQIKETAKQVFKSSTEKSSQATLYVSNMKEPNVVKAAFEESNSSQLKVNAEEMRSSSTATKCKEKMMAVEDSKKPMDGEEKLEVIEEKNKQEKFQREMNSVEVTFRWDIYRHNNKSGEENEEVVQLVNDSTEASCGLEMTNLPEEYKSRLSEPEDDAESVIQDLEISRKEIGDGVDQEGNEMRSKEGESQEEMEIQTNEAQREENIENGVDEIHREQKEEFDRTECEIKQECCYQEENDKSRIGDPKPEGTRKRFEVHREEVIGAIRNSLRDEEDSQERQGENYCTESDGDFVDSTESETIFQENEESETEEIHPKAEEKNNIEVTEEAKRYVYNLVENENAGKIDEACGQEGKVDGAKVTEDNVVVDNDGVVEISYPKKTERKSKLVVEADDGVEKENIQTGDMEQDPVVPDRSKNQSTDLYLGATESMFDHQQLKYQMTEYERGNLGFQFEEVTSQSDENEIDASSCGTGVSGQGSESNFVSSSDGKWFSNGIDSDMPCTSENQVNEAVCGSGEINQDTKEHQVHTKNEEVETYFESSFEEEWVKKGVDVQASQQPQVKEEEKKVQESKDGDCQGAQTAEIVDSEDNLRKEVEFVNKHRDRKEEMRMREIEKKERMVVERAIREVRERAFAEAREKAAAKKTAAEGRERSGKVCSETNSMSAAEKASMETKLRAQRAAVERATVEARERALEKALSEKASFKTGHKAEKSETKPNDKQSKGSVPSKSSGTDSELAERCKATFERNQRTAERAAKALAEKNMRDLLAQKEQAERNRLAEILDAEVKRWAAGKERNLRSLLSTLQYILGSDSGWQPVPLTDLITSAAVKKAYRKATLFVHPDKLQQRGASIQQKYTCEKVFDLLKDAWNKFSSEER